MKLIENNYYWIKQTKESQWEIGRFVEQMSGFIGNSTFSLISSSVIHGGGHYLFVKNCFEIDYEPIKRKKE